MLLLNLLFNFFYLCVYMSGSDFSVCVVLVRYITNLIHMEEDIQFGRCSVNKKGPKRVSCFWKEVPAGRRLQVPAAVI